MEVKKTTYAKLAQHFEVSKKTIMRDIDSLSNMGIPVYTQPGYEGGVFISPDYKFSKSFFTVQEIEDIILAFHIVNSINQKDRKSSVLKKLELLVPELVFLKEIDFYEYLKVDIIQKAITIHTPICNTINYGFNEEFFLNIKIYEEFYIIAPLSYVLRADGLYLYCSDGNRYFTFPIEEITECTKTNQTFQREDYRTEFPQN